MRCCSTPSTPRASNGCATSRCDPGGSRGSCYNRACPSAPKPPMDTQRIRAHFADSAELKLAAVDTLAPLIARAAALMTECLLADGKLLACGNGGPAAHAQPLPAEKVGRLQRQRPDRPAA